MAAYRTRRICVRLTEDEFYVLAHLAERMKKPFGRKGTVSDLVVKLIGDHITEFGMFTPRGGELPDRYKGQKMAMSKATSTRQKAV